MEPEARAEIQQSITAQEPPVTPYSPDRALNDIRLAKYAMGVFLNSDKINAQEYCANIDPNRERLYVVTVYSIINYSIVIETATPSLSSTSTIKAIKDALPIVEYANSLANQYRAPTPPLISKIAGFLRNNSNISVSHIKDMTPVQRHAELLYLETSLCKIIIGMQLSEGKPIKLFNEIRRLKSVINAYLRLGKFLEIVDSEAAADGFGDGDPSIDMDFRSGVELGVGLVNAILGVLVLSGLLRVAAKIFGFTGDFNYGINLLMKVGGWKEGVAEPAIDAEHEGLRRPLADICLIWFYIVREQFLPQTNSDKDQEMAEKIINWNLRRFPKGEFFLFPKEYLKAVRDHPQELFEMINNSNYERLLMYPAVAEPEQGSQK